MNYPGLALDSPRWHGLRTRRGDNAGWVTEALRGLRDGALDADDFRELWPDLCSEGQAYDAAYAAAPHLAELARSCPVADIAEYLIVLGLITTYAAEVPADLDSGYRWAVETALPLTLHALATGSADHELRYLMAAVAAFRGRPDLARALQDLDAVQEACPTCGEIVFPSELQAIVERDSRDGDG